MGINDKQPLELVEIALPKLDDAIIFCTTISNFKEPTEPDIDITLFIACFNEQENIIDTLNEVTTAMAKLDLTWEIIVIDDASTDRSVALVKSYMNNNPSLPIILVVRKINKGLAQNFIDAAFIGHGKYYRLINGDNVEDWHQIASILSHVGEADMLIPTHVQNESRTVFRRLLSSTFTLIVNSISGYRIKYYNGCCVHLRYDVLRWHSNSLGFDFQADIITRLLDQGKTYYEVQTVCGERAFGESKALTARNFVSVARFILELVIRRVRTDRKR